MGRLRVASSPPSLRLNPSRLCRSATGVPGMCSFGPGVANGKGRMGRGGVRGVVLRLASTRWQVSPLVLLTLLVLPLLAYLQGLSQLQAGLAKQVERTKSLSWEMGRQHQTLVLMNAVRHESDERLLSLRRELNSTEARLRDVWRVYEQQEQHKPAHRIPTENNTYSCTCPLRVEPSDFWQFDCATYDEQISYDLSRWLPQGISTKVIEEAYDKMNAQGRHAYLFTVSNDQLYVKWGTPHPHYHEGLIRMLQTTMSLVTLPNVTFTVVLSDRPSVERDQLDPVMSPIKSA